MLKMKDCITIRKAGIKDFKAVYELEKKFVNYQVKKYRLSFLVDPAYTGNTLQKEIAKKLKSKKGEFFLLEIEGKAAGFVGTKFVKPASWSKFKKSGEISQIFILPGFHGKGYGNQMIKHALDFFRKNKCDSAILQVHPKNPAQRLYSRAGFKQDFIQYFKKLK